MNTLKEMEDAARKINKGIAMTYKSINTRLLCVSFYEAQGPRPERFTYHYANRQITREQALNLFQYAT